MRLIQVFIPAAFALSCTSVSVDAIPAPSEPPPPVYEIPRVLPPRAPIGDLLGEMPVCSLVPIRSDALVSIRPEQTVCVLFELEGGYLVPRSSDEIFDETVIVTMSVSKDPESVRLEVFNPFEGMLKYRAGIRVPEDANFYSTTSCAVIGGGVAIELWWHPIDEILLGDFHFLPDGAGTLCN